MHKENFNKLKEDPKVYYIYNLGLPVFGLEGRDFYIVVTAKDWVGPLETADYNMDGPHCMFYTIEEWFKLVEECNLIPWICACVNKKYILKEYVKLLMTVDPLKIRLQYIKMKNYSHPIDIKSTLAFTLAFTKLYNQILENHKIVNFHTVGEAVKNILEYPEKEATAIYNGLILTESRYLINATDGIYKKYKIEQ